MTSEMGETPDVRELQMRIVELENKLAQMSQSGQVADLTPEELQTYAKVRDIIAIDPACGINECSRCIIYRCLCNRCYLCYLCIFECTCGPCNPGIIGGGLIGGGGRFTGLGG